jgi:hypothetical protein
MALDYRVFYDQMAKLDAGSAILRGHLWIEICLNRALNIELAVPGAIDVDRMTWRFKVSLCQALGRLDADQVVTLNRLNALRNRLAHRVDAAVAGKDIDELHRKSKGVFRVGFDSQKIDRPGDDGSRVVRLIFALAMILEAANDRRQWELDNKGKLDGYMIALAIAERSGQTVDPAEIRARIDIPDAPDPRDPWINYIEDHNGGVTRAYPD